MEAAGIDDCEAVGFVLFDEDDDVDDDGDDHCCLDHAGYVKVGLLDQRRSSWSRPCEHH